jgi:hypothetical protein
MVPRGNFSGRRYAPQRRGEQEKVDLFSSRFPFLQTRHSIFSPFFPSVFCFIPFFFVHFFFFGQIFCGFLSNILGKKDL